MYGAESLIVDIGSKTVDVIHVQKYVPVERESTSIPEALIQCMENIKSSVYQICNKKVSEDIIRQMIVDGDAMIPEDCKSVIRDGLRNFAKGIEAKLSEMGFDLEMMPVVYAVQLINVNSKMRKIEIIFKAKKAHLPLGENIIFSKDIDSLDLQYFMRLCRI